MDLIKKLKVKDILNILFYLGIYGFGTFCATNVLIFGNNPLKEQPLFLFLILFFLTIAFFITLVIFNAKTSKYIPSKTLLISSLILLSIGLFTLLVIPTTIKTNIFLENNNYKDIYYQISNKQRINYSLRLIVVFILFFTTIDILPKTFKNIDIIFLASIFVIIAVFVFCILSYVLDAKDYVKLFHSIINKDEYCFISIDSVFPNKNSYGIILFIGMCASLYCHNKNKRFYWLIIDVFFLINFAFTFCKTGFICALIITFAYYILELICSIKNNLKKYTLSLIIIGGTIILLCIALFAYLCINNKLQNIFAFITSGHGFGSLLSRFGIQYSCINLVLNTNALFGLGYQVSNDILFLMYGTEFAHNGMLELLGHGGVILFSYGILLIVYLFSNIIKDMKIDKRNSIFMLILLSISLLYTSFESGNIVMPQTLEYVYLSILIFVPIMRQYPLK